MNDFDDDDVLDDADEEFDGPAAVEDFDDTDSEHDEKLALKADCEGDELDEDDPGYWPENGPRPR